MMNSSGRGAIEQQQQQQKGVINVTCIIEVESIMTLGLSLGLCYVLEYSHKTLRFACSKKTLSLLCDGCVTAILLKQQQSVGLYI